ncbi:SDR family oxidoreductase [Catenulispora sp. NL8]|uniref:SDR family oxidoreductase n=1 Tax=Catenulispora pinistramenti TaxID=2705254 RepID=A0ABS5KKG3_9ACTN|nr:SDR family oxidoreductase [Catenulispora pinistramenti]MBS2546476.1 SDR family oxidoreductase [Catenulispora pinistramenti]
MTDHRKGHKGMQSVVIIGATQGTGKALAAEYARRGADVVITGRSAERAADVAAELAKDVPGTVAGLALDLTAPADIADRLAPIERVDRLALVGVVRDRNTMAAYNVAKAGELAVTKVVGYTAVASALAPRMAQDASVLLFGGVAKDYPYFGSTTVSAVNAAVTGLVRMMSHELAPVRVNALHPGMIEDSPFWTENADAAAAIVDSARSASLTGRLGTMDEVVDACLFLLENAWANGVDLSLDGGRRF